MEFLKHLLLEVGVKVLSADVTSLGPDVTDYFDDKFGGVQNAIDNLPTQTYNVNIQNWPNIYTVTGTINANVQNWPNVQDVAVQNWPENQQVTVANWPQTQDVNVQNWPETFNVQGQVDVGNWPAELTVKPAREKLFDIAGTAGQGTATGSAQVSGGRTITGYIYNGSSMDATVAIKFDGQTIQQATVGAGSAQTFELPAACEQFDVEVTISDTDNAASVTGKFFLHY